MLRTKALIFLAALGLSLPCLAQWSNIAPFIGTPSGSTSGPRTGTVIASVPQPVVVNNAAGNTTPKGTIVRSTFVDMN